MEIQYFEPKEINYPLWDRCIRSSLNGDLYGYSWFLDAISIEWAALVWGDYKAVMPLVFKRHLFCREVSQYPLHRSSGIYSSFPIDDEMISKFLEAIPDIYKKISMCLNRYNTQALQKIEAKGYPSFELDLISTYEKLKKSYSEFLIAKLKIAHNSKLSGVDNIAYSEYEKFLFKDRNCEVGATSVLKRIVNRLQYRNQAEIHAVYGPENMLCAAACFVRSNNNVILFHGCISREGIRYAANYFLIDHFFNKFSERNVTLSFDYVDEIWNADLYEAFGAVKVVNACYKINRLSRIMKVLCS